MLRRRLIDISPCLVYEGSSANHCFMFRYSTFQFVQTKGRSTVHTHTQCYEICWHTFISSENPKNEMAQIVERVPIRYHFLVSDGHEVTVVSIIHRRTSGSHRISDHEEN
jgi:hypothetical protein